MATADCAPDQQSRGEVKNAREIRHVLTEYRRRQCEEFANVSPHNAKANENAGRIDALEWVLGIAEGTDE